MFNNLMNRFRGECVHKFRINPFEVYTVNFTCINYILNMIENRLHLFSSLFTSIRYKKTFFVLTIIFLQNFHKIVRILIPEKSKKRFQFIII